MAAMKFVADFVQAHCGGLLKQWILSYRCNYLPHRSLTTSVIRATLHGNKPSTRNHYRAFTTSTLSNSESETSFRDIGVRRPLARAVEKAFTAVTKPTAAQTRFIPEILSGKDVLLHDRMGSGKSFGIVLALLSKARRRRALTAETTSNADYTITSLVIVPHRDLAYQFYHWVQSIIDQSARHSAVEGDAIVQMVLRGSDPLKEQISRLRSHPPHLLIGTPQGMLDVFNEDKDALQLDDLSTVVIDEVDHVIGLPSESTRTKFLPKAWRNFRKHPTPGRILLNDLFSVRRPETPSDIRRENVKDRESSSKAEDGLPMRSSSTPLQVVMSSATVDQGLIDYLTEMHWLGSSETKFSIIRGEESSEPKADQNGSSSSTVTYHALVVTRDGQIVNLQDVSAYTPPIKNDRVDDDAKSSSAQKHSAKANINPTDVRGALDSSLLEVVALCFATDVRVAALLVVPPNTSAVKAADFLRELGINARAFNLSNGDQWQNLLAMNAKSEDLENPFLLVTSTASTRGVDMPSLSHVFVLGIPDLANLDVYRHIAGRVNRFGRGGQIINILKEREPGIRDGDTVETNEPGWMGIVYRKLRITPKAYDTSIFDEIRNTTDA